MTSIPPGYLTHKDGLLPTVELVYSPTVTAKTGGHFVATVPVDGVKQQKEYNAIVVNPADRERVPGAIVVWSGNWWEIKNDQRVGRPLSAARRSGGNSPYGSAGLRWAPQVF